MCLNAAVFVYIPLLVMVCAAAGLLFCLYMPLLGSVCLSVSVPLATCDLSVFLLVLPVCVYVYAHMWPLCPPLPLSQHG